MDEILSGTTRRALPLVVLARLGPELPLTYHPGECKPTLGSVRSAGDHRPERGQAHPRRLIVART